MIKWFDRQLVYYLRRKGWTVFWLDEFVNCLNIEHPHDCYVALYRESELRRKRDKDAHSRNHISS